MDTFLIIIGMIFIAVVGIISILYPENMWHFEHFLDVKDGEPTDWYIQTCRIRGLIFILVDIVVIIIFLVT